MKRTYSYTPSFSTDFTVRYCIEEKYLFSGLSFSFGLKLLGLSVIYADDYFMDLGSPKFNLQYYYLPIPFSASYSLEKWMNARVGINNNFQVWTNDETEDTKNKYALVGSCVRGGLYNCEKIYYRS